MATHILDKLSGDKKMACIKGLHLCEQAQGKLSTGNWNAALDFSMRAMAEIIQIPETEPLLGITKADIAAALGNLGRNKEATRMAEEALPLVQGVPELAETEAALHMTVGIACFKEGNTKEGLRHFAIARQIFGSIPSCSRKLEILESNEARLRKIHHKNGGKWWKFW